MLLYMGVAVCTIEDTVVSFHTTRGALFVGLATPTSQARLDVGRLLG